MSAVRSSLALACVLASLAAACGEADDGDDELASGNAAQTAAPPPATWFEIDPIQSGNAWQTCARTGGGAAVGAGTAAPESAEGALVRSCLGSRGVTFGTIAFLQPAAPAGGCASLGCPRGDTLVVEVTKGPEKMRAFGFRPLALKTFAKNACTDVPFAVRSGVEQRLGASRMLDVAREQNVPVTDAGIGFTPPGPQGCGYRAILVRGGRAQGAGLEARRCARADDLIHP